MADGGIISYVVESDTKSLLTAEKVADNFVLKIGQGMKKADQEVSEFKRSLTMMGRTVRDTGEVVTAFGKKDKAATRELQLLNAQAKLASYHAKGIGTSMTKAAAGVKKATSGFHSSRAAMTNVSYQLQDIIVQSQMGTNGFVIMAQQVPQLLSGFGALGAGIGVAVALLGALGPAAVSAFGAGEDAADAYEKAVDKVNAAVTLSADGTATFTDQVQRLARYSKSAARQMLLLAQGNALVAQQKAAEALSDSFEDLSSSLDRYFGGLNDRTAELTTKLIDLSTLGESMDIAPGDDVSVQFAEARKRVESLNNALNDLKSSQSEDNIDKVTKAVNGLMVQGQFTTKAAADLAAQVYKMVSAIYQGKDASEALNEAQERLANGGLLDNKDRQKELESQSKATAEKLQSLRHDVAVLETSLHKGAAAAEDLKTELDLTEAGKNLPTKELDKIIEKAKKLNAERRSLEKQQTGVDIAKNVSTTENVQTNYNTDIGNLEAANKARLISHQQYIAAKEELDAKYAQQYIESQGALGKAALSATNTFASGAATAFSQIMSGTKSAEDAMRGLAQTIIQSVLQSLIQTAVQYTVLPALARAFGMAQAEASATAATAATAATTTTAAASTAASGSVAAAAAPAAAATATWSFGSAAIAGAAALGSIFLLSKTLSGNRRYGGGVSSGNMYQINESGTPEVYSYGNKDYLMGTQNAQITPLDNYSNGSNISVNVNNYASDTVSATVSKTSSGFDINVMSKKVEKNLAARVEKQQGPLSSAIKSRIKSGG